MNLAYKNKILLHFGIKFQFSNLKGISLFQLMLCLNGFFTYCFWGAGLLAGDLTAPGGRATGVTWGDLDTGPVTTGLGLEPGVPYNKTKKPDDFYQHDSECSDFNDTLAFRAENHLITNFNMTTIEWLMITMATCRLCTVFCWSCSLFISSCSSSNFLRSNSISLASCLSADRMSEAKH